MLKGTLDDFTLPDVFRLMSFAKKTGRVDVLRSAGQGKVFFRDGEVYYAESSLSKEPLGQKLVRARALTEGQLMKALDEHASSGQRLGTVLLQSGLITEDQLESAVRQQIEDSIFDLLRWELGEFQWEPGDAVDTEVSIGVSVENLIMEASRRLDEYEVIRRKIPSGQAILGMAATPPEGAVEINITPDEWRILVLVDGTRSVNDIARMVGLDEFGAMRVLYGLVSAGLIELISEGTQPEAQAAIITEEPVVAAPEPVQAIEPEPVVAEPVQAIEPEPVHAAAPEPVVPEPVAIEDLTAITAPDPVAEPVPVDEAVPDLRTQIDSVAEAAETPTPAAEATGPGTDDARAVAISSGIAGEMIASLSAEEPAEPPSDDLDAFGIAPIEFGESPVVDEASWDEPVPIEAFDAPKPDELVTETPVADSTLADPFPADLLDRAIGTPPEEPPVAPAAPTEDIPVSSAPSGEAPSVDRAAAVRELASLFSDEEKPRARPSAPLPPGEGDGQDTRKRVEDDDQVTKGIISRLIDGVKGL